MMRNLKMVVAYDGAGYRGWQSQPDGPTVEDEVTRAVEQIFGTTGGMTVAGRTDAGVHSKGQVVSVLVREGRTPKDIVRAMNAVLPGDVAVTMAEWVDEDFDARRMARARRYSYRLRVSKVRPVLDRSTVWWMSRRLDLAAVEVAGRRLEGNHDFAGFTASRDRSTRRRLDKFDMNAAEGPGGGVEVVMGFTANSFTHHMVRLMVGTLVKVGDGSFEPERISTILRTGDVTLSGPKAPAKGLVLEEVLY